MVRARQTAFLATLSIVLVLFAGCVGSKAETPTTRSTSVAPAPEPTVTDETGSVTGTVTDDSLAPLAGVEVGLVEGKGLMTVSDDSGSFTINDVPPGSYAIVANRIGYTQQAKKVNVVAGETATVKFQLEAIAVPTARQQSWSHVGLIRNGVAVVALATAVNLTGNFYDWYIEITDSVVSASTGLKWEANAPTSAKWMYHSIWLTKSNCADVCTRLNFTYGRSPLATRADELEIEGKGYEINPLGPVLHRHRGAAVPDDGCRHVRPGRGRAEVQRVRDGLAR